MAVVFIGLAIAKPWSSSGGPPIATLGPRGGAVSSGSQPPTVAAPTPSIPPIPAVPAAFTTSLPPPATAAWTGIRWHRLAPADPLTLVASVLRWRGGFIALGWTFSDGATSTPVWTSKDGAQWTPLPLATSATFWPGMLVIGLAEVPSGLVALTEAGAGNDCGAPDCQLYTPAVVAWTSSDGRVWTPRGGLDLGLPASNGGAPVLAAGPSGLVVASTTSNADPETSADGIHWRTVASGAYPRGFHVAALAWTPTGFTAVGVLTIGTPVPLGNSERAVALQSKNGTTWSGPFPLDGTGPSWGATGVVAARRGFIAVGAGFGSPQLILWWQSPDGRVWRGLPTYAPLGRPSSCSGEGCADRPNGLLIGDGERMVALRGGHDAGVWTSFDGLSWRTLPVTGEVPSAQATQAVLLPGGILLSDGRRTWFGEALTR